MSTEYLQQSNIGTLYRFVWGVGGCRPETMNGTRVRNCTVHIQNTAEFYVYDLWDRTILYNCKDLVKYNRLIVQMEIPFG